MTARGRFLGRADLRARLVPFESVRALDSLHRACLLSANLTSPEHAFEICTQFNTATPLRRQVDIVQVSCEEKSTRKV
jgi:hypothetical protein